MGGCFAEEDGKTMDSYWPAEMVDISDNEIVMLERNTFPGGSSQNDVYESQLFVDLTNPPAPVVAGTIPYGYANSQIADGSWIMSGVYFTTHSNNLVLQFGNSTKSLSFFQGWCRVLAKENTCTWWVDDLKLAELTASFSLNENLTRNRFLRSGQVRQFCYMAYRNAQTGVRWQVSAMQSPAGLPAIWSNDSLTLTEI